VRDLWIQKRKNDLVLATFGRGFWVLDDYSVLRTMTPDVAKSELTLFPTRDASLYVERVQLGIPGKSFQGDSYFTAPNPPFGAVFTYYLKDEIKTRKKQRWETESTVEKSGGNEPMKIPPLEQLRAEEREVEPAVVMIVADEEGNVVRRVTGPVKAGFHRVAWDLRYPPPSPVELKEPEPNPFSPPPPGPLAAPGKYTVRIAKRVDGTETVVGTPQTFNVVPLYLPIMQESDRAAVLDFQKRAARLQRAVMGADKATADALTRVKYIRKALDLMQNVDPKLLAQVNALETTLHDVDDQINGDPVLRSHNEPAPPSLMDRVNTSVGVLTTTSATTTTEREALQLAQDAAAKMLDRLRTAVQTDLAAIEKQLNAAGAPWTPGRIPEL
jgi:hypothetical protein